MTNFWILTYIDTNDQIRRQRFDNEEEARSSWYDTERALFLDEVQRLESTY